MAKVSRSRYGCALMPDASINWGSVADWVSGLGSLSASAVALYLARSSDRIRLRCTCGIRFTVGGGMPEESLVWISVTNVGRRPTRVTTVGLTVGSRWGKGGRRAAILRVPASPYCSPLPLVLHDGETGQWAIPLDAQRSWVSDLVRDMVPDAEARATLRFFIGTSHGAEVSFPPEQSLLDDLREAAERA